MTDPFGENRKNPVEEQKSILIPNQNTIINTQNTLRLSKRWKKLNEIQLTNNKMDLNDRNYSPSTLKTFLGSN